MKPYRFPLLGVAWIAYMAFTIIGYPLFGVSVMLPSVLLCGFATWLRGYKWGLFTLLLTLPYNMLAIMHNQGDPQSWHTALEPGGIAAQMVAIGLVAIANNNHRKSLELTAILENRILEKGKELEKTTEYMLRQSVAEHTDVKKKLYNIVTIQLTRLLIHSESLMNFLSYDDAPQTADAAKLVQIAEQNIEQIKTLTRKLSLERITETGIKQALHEMCTYFTETADTCFSISISHHQQEIPDPVALHIYRIAHEAVTNALRHGKAMHIDLSLKQEGESCTLKITNDGVPMEKNPNKGLGMRLIQQRAKTINATISLETTDTGETCFVCTIPCIKKSFPRSVSTARKRT